MHRAQVIVAMSALICLPAWSFAQSDEAQPSNAEILETLRRLEQRVQKLEQRHEQDQNKIQELEASLDRAQSQAKQASLDAQQAIEVAEAESRLNAQEGPFSLSTAGRGSGNLLNPEITVFVDTGGSISSDGSNNALNRFNLREVELDFRAAVTPWADGVLVLALHEEIEQQANGDVDIESEVEIEEGYLDMHTLPFDLAARIGKFRSVFGRNNTLHTHDLPQVTRPLAIRNFFGNEGLVALGARLSWLVPNPWDKYIELTTEVINPDGGHHAPILGGPNAEHPAVVGRIKYFDDLTENSTIEIGGSYLFTTTSSDNDFDGNVFGLDVSYHWKHPDPSAFKSLLLQGEFFWADNDRERGFPFGSERNNSFGFYAFGQYQFHRDWYGGLRFDYAEFPNSASRGTDDRDIALSPYVSWYVNEFLRLRLAYEHRMFDEFGTHGSEEAVFLQATFTFGSHPPHPYWVYR